MIASIEPPVFTTTPEGVVKCAIRIEVERPFKQRGSNEYGKDLIDISVWEGIAVTLKDTLEQGAIVMVRGRLEQDDYIDPNSGETAHYTKVIGERILYMKNEKEEE